MDRYRFLGLSAAWAVSAAMPMTADAEQTAAAVAELAAVEKTTGGRLGVSATDFGSMTSIVHRERERFPMCSTFKALAVSAVLARVDRGSEHLDREIAYGKSELVGYAPVTTANVARGRLSVAALCEAAITQSDNTAANLLVTSVGGPSAVTAFVRGRALGDSETRLDRYEPAMSASVPGDPRDTTLPALMANDVAQLLMSAGALSSASSQRLLGWMRHCQTGDDTLRAGFPAGWTVANKTGSGDHGTRNDVAYVTRLNRKPIVVAAYLTGATGVSADARNAALAQVARIVSRTFAHDRV